MATDEAAGDPAEARDYEAVFVNHVKMVRSIVGFIARRRQLSADESEEFGAHVNLKLIEDNYDVFRRFRGRSSLRTYLSVVIHRLFLDWRTAQWGRWRPSAPARHLGKVAMLFERLTVRDGLSFEQARTVLETQYRMAIDPRELESIYGHLPARAPRRHVGEGVLLEIPASYGDPAFSLAADASASAASDLAEMLSALMAGLDSEDQTLLKSHFLEGRSVLEIARASSQDSRRLYRRIARLLARLRAGLEQRGVRYGDVQELFEHCDVRLADTWG
jgi:RNA polymerase sigma factor (sigma-70 family)